MSISQNKNILRMITTTNMMRTIIAMTMILAMVRLLMETRLGACQPAIQAPTIALGTFAQTFCRGESK